MLETVSAILFTVFCGAVVLFQICLAAGLPWGAASMGGKFPGKYPTRMRFVAVVNALVLLGLICIALSIAGVIFPGLESFSRTAIWFVVASSGVSVIVNTFTPSKLERIWAPVAAVMLVTSLIIAIG